MNPCDPHCGYLHSLQSHNIYPPFPKWKRCLVKKMKETWRRACMSVSVSVYITPSAPWATIQTCQHTEDCISNRGRMYRTLLCMEQCQQISSSFHSTLVFKPPGLWQSSPQHTTKCQQLMLVSYLTNALSPHSVVPPSPHCTFWEQRSVLILRLRTDCHLIESLTIPYKALKSWSHI